MKLSNKISLAVLLIIASITFTTIAFLKTNKEQIEIAKTIESYDKIYAVIEKARTARLKYVDDSFNDCIAKEGFDKCVNLSSLSKELINDNYNKMTERTDELLLNELGGLSGIEKVFNTTELYHLFGLTLIENQTNGVGRK